MVLAIRAICRLCCLIRLLRDLALWIDEQDIRQKVNSRSRQNAIQPESNQAENTEVAVNPNHLRRRRR